MINWTPKVGQMILCTSHDVEGVYNHGKRYEVVMDSGRLSVLDEISLCWWENDSYKYFQDQADILASHLPEKGEEWKEKYAIGTWWKTRVGLVAVIQSHEAHDHQPVVGRITEEDGQIVISKAFWTVKGGFFVEGSGPSLNDLISRIDAPDNLAKKEEKVSRVCGHCCKEFTGLFKDHDCEFKHSSTVSYGGEEGVNPNTEPIQNPGVLESPNGAPVEWPDLRAEKQEKDVELTTVRDRAVTNCSRMALMNVSDCIIRLKTTSQQFSITNNADRRAMLGELEQVEKMAKELTKRIENSL